jgi:hypothetical protein
VLYRQVILILLLLHATCSTRAQLSLAQTFNTTSSSTKFELVNNSTAQALSFFDCAKVFENALPEHVINSDRELARFQKALIIDGAQTANQLSCLNTLSSFAKAKKAMQNRRFGDAQYLYSQAENVHLTNQQLVEKNFNTAYAVLQQTDNLQDSSVSKRIASLMNGIRNIPGQYSNAGNYYYGMLQYLQGNYTQSLQSLLPLISDKNYESLLYYPIAHSQYALGQITACEKTLQQNMAMPKAARKFEAQSVHLAMQVMYEQEKFDDVIKYGNMVGDVRAILPTQRFEYAYAALQLQDYEVAADAFSSLQADTNNKLAARAYYFAGSANLAKKDSAKALKQFAQIAESPDLSKQEQNTTWQNIAALSYANKDDETAYLYAYKLTENTTPSIKKDAIAMLADLSLRSKNKSVALKELMKFADDEKAAATIQKMAYQLALENFNTKAYENLKGYTTNCNDYGTNKNIGADANYLLLLSAFKQNKWTECIALTSLALPAEKLCDKHWMFIHSYLQLYQLDSVKQYSAVADSFKQCAQCKEGNYQASWVQLNNIFNAEQMQKRAHRSLIDSLKSSITDVLGTAALDSVLSSTLTTNADSAVVLFAKSKVLFAAKKKSEAYAIFKALGTKPDTLNYSFFKGMVAQAKTEKDSIIDMSVFTNMDTTHLAKSKDYYDYKYAATELAIARGQKQCAKEMLESLLIYTVDASKKKLIVKQISKL